MHVGVLGGRGVLDLVGQLDAPVVVALVAVLSDLSVGLRIEIFRLHRRNIPHVAGNVGVDPARPALLLLCGLVGRDVAHVAHYRRLL